jgi:hypothetical protein
MNMLQAPPLSHSRRRSVDVGGLSLALGSQGLGQGWVGWDESEVDTEEQQLLCVILLNHSSQLTYPRSVSQNFLAICTITPTLSSMLTNNRTSIHTYRHALLDTLSPEGLSMFRWSVVPSLSGLWIIGTSSLTNFPNTRYFTALSSSLRHSFASRAS